MIAHVDSLLLDLLGDDFHAAGAVAIPGPPPVPASAAVAASRETHRRQTAVTVRPRAGVPS